VNDPYLWLKALHVAGFAAWMAAMWYLPRLFVYHAGAAPGSESSETFKTMERRLLRAIGTPAMVATWLFGLAMILLGTRDGRIDLGQDAWLHAKLVLLVALSAVHGLLAAHVGKFGRDERPRPARWYRAVNEVPTVIFLGVVLLAVLRPF
jgi:putative membrane protein